MNKESAFAPSLAGVSNLEFPLHPQNPRLDVRHGGHPLGLVHPGQTEDGHWSRRQGHVEGERTPSATVSRYHPGQWVLAFPGIRGLERAVNGWQGTEGDGTQGTDRVVMVGRTLHVVSIHLCSMLACIAQNGPARLPTYRISDQPVSLSSQPHRAFSRGSPLGASRHVHQQPWNASSSWPGIDPSMTSSAPRIHLGYSLPSPPISYGC